MTLALGVSGSGSAPPVGWSGPRGRWPDWSGASPASSTRPRLDGFPPSLNAHFLPSFSHPRPPIDCTCRPQQMTSRSSSLEPVRRFFLLCRLAPQPHPPADRRARATLSTGTSGTLPNVACLVNHLAEKPLPPCRTCLSTLTPQGKHNIRRNTSAVVRSRRPDGSKS